jgi:hypothetical protein
MEAATMTVIESKGLKKGNRVYWRGDTTDSGTITETSWDAVTIAWDNRGGPGCLNRFSASISGASARVRLPSGVAAG